MLHTPSVQVALPLSAEHTIPQPPQWFTSLSKPESAYSQPSPGRPLQSLNPASQAPTEQEPPEQLDVAFATSQAMSQPPQLSGLVTMFVSQSPLAPPQSAWPIG